MINILKSTVFLFLITLYAPILSATNSNKGSYSGQLVKDTSLLKVVRPTSTHRWLAFKDKVSISPKSFFKDYSKALELSANSEMKLVNIHKDKIGMKHYHFQQYYNGIRVEDGQYIIHAKSGIPRSANGIIISNLSTNTSPTISKNVALNTVISAVAQNTNTSANSITHSTGKLILTLKEELDIPPFKGKCNDSNCVLAYKFNIQVKGSSYAKDVYVNAKNGKILRETSNIHWHCKCCSGGEVETSYNGTHSNLTTEHKSLFDLQDYHTVDKCKKILGFTTDNFSSGSFDDEIVESEDNIWTASENQATTSAFWAVQRSYKYFKNVHQRPGIDSSDLSVNIKANFDFHTWSGGTTSNVNASYREPDNCDKGGACIRLGRGDNDVGDMVSLDIVGHEWTHGVIDFSAEFGDNGESGALKESFSDIFGATIEFWVEGSSTGDWLIGEDPFSLPGGSLVASRSLANPERSDVRTPGPDTYLSGSGDNCTVCWDDFSSGDIHERAGVQNFFYYLLVEGSGGTATNDRGTQYNVVGIGHNDARKIAYKALVNYLPSHSDNATLADSKNAWVKAAIDIFGLCSQQVASTKEAWEAVGVGGAVPGVDNQNITLTGGFCNFINGIADDDPIIIKAVETITSNCNHSVSNNLITYKAGDQITLTDGFHSGPKFKAIIDEICAAPIQTASINNSSHSHINNQTTNRQKTQMQKEKGNYLKANQPNPYKNQTSIQYGLQKESKVNLYITNITGQRVAWIIKGESQTNGKHKINFDGASLSPGIYFYTLETKDFRASRKMVITR